MSLPDDDALLLRLRKLPSPSLPAAARDRALVKAQRELAREGRLSTPAKIWSAGRTAVSVALVLSAALYAVDTVNTLGRIYVSASP
ncbi:MAG TPA: hypothetical protein VK459_23010 [Polyangiaceae bacterium]|jgi:hypothetical protein|nr:hypothetical protein [Polyangiaceae bacterium]